MPLPQQDEFGETKVFPKTLMTCGLNAASAAR